MVGVRARGAGGAAQPALLALCAQLEADPDDLVVYGARGGGITWLEWLRTPAAGSSPAEILAALEKLEYLRLLGGERVDLS
ncbi:MAG: hypothetical protein ABSG43_16090, partial [Solirubrobacteraceae bacterium]